MPITPAGKRFLVSVLETDTIYMIKNQPFMVSVDIDQHKKSIYDASCLDGSI
jgi:hypothetical protein